MSATRIQTTWLRITWLRITVQAVCVLVPLAVVLSHVYRGMHYPADVVAGLTIGAACAVIAWNWLPPRTRAHAPQAGVGAQNDAVTQTDAVVELRR